MGTVQTRVMSADAGIRLERLRSLFSRPIEMREKTGRSASFCSDLLNGRKSFGEKLARDLEEQLELPRGWFDLSGDGSDKPAQDEEAELLAAFRALAGDPVARARVLAYAGGFADSAKRVLSGELSDQTQQLDPARKSAA